MFRGSQLRQFWPDLQMLESVPTHSPSVQAMGSLIWVPSTSLWSQHCPRHPRAGAGAAGFSKGCWLTTSGPAASEHSIGPCTE